MIKQKTQKKTFRKRKVFVFCFGSALTKSKILDFKNLCILLFSFFFLYFYWLICAELRVLIICYKDPYLPTKCSLFTRCEWLRMYVCIYVCVCLRVCVLRNSLLRYIFVWVCASVFVCLEEICCVLINCIVYIEKSDRHLTSFYRIAKLEYLSSCVHFV